MKTAFEFVEEAARTHTGVHHYPADWASEAGAPDLRAFLDALAGAAEAYHAHRLKEALGGDGPVSVERLEEIRHAEPSPFGWLSSRASEMLHDLLAALDHVAAQNLALEGLIEDYQSDHAHLIEEGRRRERGEVVAEIRRIADITYADLVADAFGLTADEIASRGPLPDALPAARARERVKELEAALGRLREDVGSEPVGVIKQIITNALDDRTP
jgi:hypothetical protein